MSDIKSERAAPAIAPLTFGPLIGETFQVLSQNSRALMGAMALPLLWIFVGGFILEYAHKSARHLDSIEAVLIQTNLGFVFLGWVVVLSILWTGGAVAGHQIVLMGKAKHSWRGLNYGGFVARYIGVVIVITIISMVIAIPLETIFLSPKNLTPDTLNYRIAELIVFVFAWICCAKFFLTFPLVSINADHRGRKLLGISWTLTKNSGLVLAGAFLIVNLPPEILSIYLETTLDDPGEHLPGTLDALITGCVYTIAMIIDVVTLSVAYRQLTGFGIMEREEPAHQ